MNNHKPNVPSERFGNQVAVHIAQQINYALSTGRRRRTNSRQNETIGESSVRRFYASADVGTKHRDRS